MENNRVTHNLHHTAPNLVSLPHPLTGDGREVCHLPFEPGETLGRYVVRAGVRLSRGPVTVTVNGRELPADLWRGYLVIDGDYIVVRQAVAGGGGGGKILRSIAMIALALTAPYIAGYALTGTWAAATGIAGSLATAGVMLGGSLLINALLPPPRPKTSTVNNNQQGTLYALNGGRNSVRAYEPMPLVIGRHKMVPDLASQPYTEQWGDNSYLYQAFHFGVQPDLLIDNIRIGETAAGSFSEVQIERAGPDGRLSLIAGNVDTVAGFDLRSADGWQTRTLSRDTVEIQIELAARLYFMHDDGSMGQRQANVEVEYRAVGSAAWLPAGEVWSTDMHDYYWSKGYWGKEQYYHYGEVVSRKVWIQSGFDSNLSSTAHRDGEYAGGNSFWRWRPYSDIDPDRQNNVRGLAPDRVIRTYQTSLVPMYGANASNPARKTLRIVVAKGQYEVRLRKTTGDITADRESNVVAVSQLRSYQEDAGDYAGHNRLAMKVRATAQLNGAIDQLNVTASAACPVWIGSAWETQATSNPAWWFLWFARGRHDAGGRRLYGAALPDSRIDLEAIKAWAAWCDHKKLTCNLVLNQQKSIAEVLGIIARCGRASPTWQTGRLGVVWDVDNAPVSCVFAPFNIRSGSFRVEYTGDQTADEVIVQFMNPETWQTDEVRAVVPGVTMPSNPVTLQLEGCTDVGMAGREANLLAASQLYHRRRMSWETDVEGLVVNRGDVVQLSHDMTAWSLSGRLQGSSGMTVRLDQPIPSPASGWMLLRHPNGDMATVRVSEVSEDCMTATLAIMPGIALPDEDTGHVPLDWTWMYDPLATPGRRVKIVSVEPLDDGNNIRLTAVDDDPGYYACEDSLYDYVPPRDTTLFALPVFDLRISEGQADIQTGEVALTLGWSQFVSTPVEVAWQVRGAGTHRLQAMERRCLMTAKTGDVLDITVTPWLLTGPGQATSLSHTVQGYLSRLPAVTGLTTIYRDKLLWLVWSRVTDYRNPEYEVRTGDDWDNSRLLGTTPLAEMLAHGSGDYWVAARWRAPTGQIVYGPAAGIDVTGGTLVRNVMAVRNEHPAWAGTLSGQADRRGHQLVLAGSGSLPDCPDVLVEPDVLWYGGSDGTGHYRTDRPVDVGREADCLLAFDLSVRGERHSDNVLTMMDVLAAGDFTDVSASSFIRAVPQLRMAGNDGIWSDWRDYVPGLTVARHFDVRLQLESHDPLVTPVVDSFSWSVDMPDRQDQGTHVQVPADGLTVVYQAPFNGGPSGEDQPNVLVTVIEAAAGDVVELTGSTLAGFSVRIRGGTGYVSRAINWIAQGY